MFIIDSLVSGGKERQLVELLKGLKEREAVEIILIVLSNEIHYQYIQDLNIKILHLHRRHKKDLRIFFSLYKLCKDIRPDIIHSWESMCSVYCAPISKLLGIKLINGIIRWAPSNLSIFSKGWLRSKATFLLSDFIVANSHAGLKAYGVNKKKGIVIHNGFDFTRIENILNSVEMKRTLNIQTPFVVGMVARFHPRKYYDKYISAAMHVLNERRDVTFLAVGDGVMLNECRRMILPQHRERFLFLGRRQDVESIVNMIDIGVLASHSEGISNAIMEYMALGKPVIATDHGGTRELVVDKVTGFLVTSNSAFEMAQKILHLLNEREVAINMGLAGRERLERQFQLTAMTKEYMDVYKSCLQLAA